MKLVEYVKSSYGELVNKVSWPTWQELFNSSIVVLIASLIFALFILIMDQASDFVLTNLYKLLG